MTALPICVTAEVESVIRQAQTLLLHVPLRAMDALRLAADPTTYQRLATLGDTIVMGNPDHQAVALRYLQTLAESDGRLSDTLRQSQPHIPW